MKQVAAMHVLQVCAEIYPLLKTGGLADVAGALPCALHTEGGAAIEVRVLLPGFAPILAGLQDAVTVAELPPRAGVSGGSCACTASSAVSWASTCCAA